MLSTDSKSSLNYLYLLGRNLKNVSRPDSHLALHAVETTLKILQTENELQKYQNITGKTNI